MTDEILEKYYSGLLVNAKGLGERMADRGDIDPKRVNYNVQDRKRLAAKIKKEENVSNREIARRLNVHHSTIAADLDGLDGGFPPPANLEEPSAPDQPSPTVTLHNADCTAARELGAASVVGLMPQRGKSGTARDKAAKSVGVGQRYIQDAKKIEANEPELAALASVYAGKVRDHGLKPPVDPAAALNRLERHHRAASFHLF